MNRSYVVNSNISLHYIPMDKLKTTTIGIFIHRKLCEEEVSMNALLPYILKRGCTLCNDTAEIAKYLENLYGATLSSSILKKGDDQIIAFTAETISDKFAANNEDLLSDLIKLLMSIIFSPVTEDGNFKKEYLEQEKTNMVDRINGIINDKRSYAQLRCMQEMFKGDPSAIYSLGTVEDVEKITAAGLMDHYRKMISNSPIDIFICGDAEIEKISETIKEIKLPFAKADIPKADILKKSDKVKNITDKMEVTQGKLCMGFVTGIPASDDDFITLMVANSIFGSGAHSKLFNNVREKLSLCYYASSSLNRFKGIMLVNAGIEFENFQKAHDEILVQLDSMKKGEISDFEFDAAVNALVNGYQSAYDDPMTLQGIYLGEIVAGTSNSPADYIEKIKKVTKEDIIRVINKVEPDTVYFLTGKGDEA